MKIIEDFHPVSIRDFRRNMKNCIAAVNQEPGLTVVLLRHKKDVAYIVSPQAMMKVLELEKALNELEEEINEKADRSSEGTEEATA